MGAAAVDEDEPAAARLAPVQVVHIAAVDLDVAVAGGHGDGARNQAGASGRREVTVIGSREIDADRPARVTR